MDAHPSKRRFEEYVLRSEPRGLSRTQNANAGVHFRDNKDVARRKKPLEVVLRKCVERAA